METNMTDTRYFKTIAIHRPTGQWRTFYSIFPHRHRAAALKWLASIC